MAYLFHSDTFKNDKKKQKAENHKLNDSHCFQSSNCVNALNAIHFGSLDYYQAFAK